jgi:ribosomal subunit interface protein
MAYQGEAGVSEGAPEAPSRGAGLGLVVEEPLMQVPLQIRFHNMASSDAIETRVRERVTRLERFSGDIISCRVTIEAPHKQPHRSTVGITIDIGLAGKEIVVKREARHHESRDDAYNVIGIAFDTAERQLEEHVRVSRRSIKTHDGPIYARVVRLYPEQDYGFIETPGQPNVYFHRIVVEDDEFDQLEVGSEVRYSMADEEGAMGPQASRVRLVKGGHALR